MELERRALVLTAPGGQRRRLNLDGASHRLIDATDKGRFTRHLRIELAVGPVDLITPPEEGAIAPRVLRLPPAPDGAYVVERSSLKIVASWLAGGGRMRGWTVDELSHFARLASSNFAVALGDVAGQVAVEMSWDRQGPLRGANGVEPRLVLWSLERAARDSERAHEAFVAALARCAQSPTEL